MSGFFYLAAIIFIGFASGVVVAGGVFAFIAAIGVVERLERDFPDKKFVLVSPKAVCANMKWIHLEDILNSLEAEQHEIDVNPDLAKRAYAPIEKMVGINS